MPMIIDELQRALSQIIVFSIPPLVWWAIWWFSTKRTRVSFFRWVGLKMPLVSNARRFVVPICLALGIAILMPMVVSSIIPTDVQLANAQFRGQGVKALVPAIIFAFFATALPEEVLFRGFLGKRLIGRFGFLVGNTVQAFVFGLLHGVMLFSTLGWVVPCFIIALTGTLGWLMGYVNEQADGSILPSWCIHGLANVYAAVLIMF